MAIAPLYSVYTSEQLSGLATDLGKDVATVRRRAKAGLLRKEFESLGLTPPDLEYSKYAVVAEFWHEEEFDTYEAWTHLKVAEEEGYSVKALGAAMGNMYGEIKTWEDYGKKMVNPAKNILVTDAPEEVIALAQTVLELFG